MDWNSPSGPEREVMRLFNPWSPLCWTRLRLGAALLMILQLGLLTVRWAVRRHDHFLREELLRKTYIVAQAVPLDRVLALKGDRSDEERPEYRRLKTQLITAAQIEPSWEWIYLMGRNENGDVFFQMDSEAFDAEDPSPPGQVYPEASPLLHRVFETGAAATEGPLPDRWGVWVSAFVPLKDASTGRLVTVVGVDIEAGTWRMQTWRAGLAPGLLTLALMAVLLTGYVLRGQPDKASGKIKHHWRHLEAGLTAAIGLILTLAGVWLALGIETSHSREAFLALAHMKANHLLNAFQNIRNFELESFGRFFENSDEVTPEEFRNYARYLSQTPEVSAWGWIPLVEAADRPAFVQRVREWAGNDFDLWEFDRDGGRTRAPERPFHCPLLFLESSGPRENRAIEPGFDLASLPELARLLDPADRPTLPFASDPFVLEGNDPSLPSIWVFRPVRSGPDRGLFRGYVLAALRPQHLLKTILDAHLDRNPLIHMELLELRQDAPPARLASTLSSDPFPPLLSASPPSPSLTLPILAFGRTYAVRSYPSPDFFRQHAAYLGWITFFAGLVVTAACTLMVSFLAHRREDLERLVEQRASDLALMMRRYDQLAHHSRTVTWELDADGRFSDVSDVAREVWGCAPDDLTGRHIADLHPEEGRTAFRQQLQAAFADRRPFLHLPHPVQARSGDVRWMSASGIPLLDDHGRLRGYQGTDTDITERKRSEDELARLARQNQNAVERYQALISASNTGAWEYDDQTARLWTSPEYFQMLGRDPAKLASDSETSTVESAWLDLLHPDDKDAAMRRFSAYLRHPGRLYQQTFRMRHADGSWVWILSRGRALLDAQGRPTPIVVGTHIDITETKRAEQDLRESRRRFAALLANLPGMAYRCAHDENWTMEFVSEGCRKLTGYAPEDLIGNRTVSFNQLIVDTHRRRLRDKWQERLARRMPFEDEYEITTRSGDIRWVWEKGEGVFDEAGNLLALEGFIADITDRKHAGIERDRLMAAIEQSGDAVVITDARGAILYVNPAFSKVTGYSREESLGQNPRILQSGVHDRDFYRQMWAALSAGRAWQGQIVNRRKDGSLYTELASISPVRNGEGRIAYFVAVKRDITQQLLDQKEREDLQSRLVQAQKMESIGRLAGGIAHDFNNMLQAILGYAEMGLEEVKEGQPLHSDLLEIQKAARRSAALTQQLQAFARKQPVRPKILDLNAAIASMTGMLRPLLGEQIALEWVPGDGAARIQVDPSHLDQVITNLCVNARDAISGPGRIRVETDTVRLDRPLLNLHGDIPPGDYVRLTVTDNGCGMAPGMIEHIFEPFFTTKTAGKGTGLGLATVYGILQQNHAIPRVQSRPGQGSTFQVYFPRLPDQGEPAPLARPDDPALLQSLRGTETILIAEDETALLQTARRMLESLGYTVRACESPTEALRLLEAAPLDFDLLLTDVMMPDMSGPDLVRQALAVRPDLPHLYMSGYAANLLAKKGVRNTGAGFLQKPFSRIQIAQKIRDILGRHPSA